MGDRPGTTVHQLVHVLTVIDRWEVVQVEQLESEPHGVDPAANLPIWGFLKIWGAPRMVGYGWFISNND